MTELPPCDSADGASAPWPIVPAAPSALPQAIMDRIEQLARKQLRGFPRLNDCSIFGENLRSGYREGPTLFLEDHQGIELMPPHRVASHEYRIFGLARSKDFLLLSRSRARSFEQYLAGILSQDSAQILCVDRGDSRIPMALSAACLKDEPVLSKLAAAASAAGTLNICPYLSSGYDWLLGAEIARRSGCPVQICGPLPQISRRVNDKLWFSDQVRQILGEASVPPTYSVYGPIAAASVLARLARTHERVVIKLPASAGSMGNLVLESEFVRSLSLAGLRDELLRRLHAIGWQDRFPILVGVWEAGALSSPSAQMWIPQPGEGLPVIEGIFGQNLTGVRQAFSGAIEIELPDNIQDRLRREALAISYYFQCLGYFGRLSLDALLVGTEPGNSELHWIECNGRWGGVSIPMMVARRLPTGNDARALLIVQRFFSDAGIANFDELLKRAKPWIYTKTTGEGIVFLEPTDSEQNNVTFFVVARSQEAAEQMGSEALQAIIPDSSMPQVTNI
ncbi:hypothetical protein [Parasphingorhabdus sp.]|uniref:preATP grasp domain-containing protein n=1 Tax=Parasphingorhabdus sp. TaxID=2709688 RepID=UPI003A91C857